MAGTTGLEPATSAVTGQRSNQLSYVPRLPLSNMDISRRMSDVQLSLLTLFHDFATLNKLQHLQRDDSYKSIRR
jgi:hypothetical protein